MTCFERQEAAVDDALFGIDFQITAREDLAKPKMRYKRGECDAEISQV